MDLCIIEQRRRNSQFQMLKNKKNNKRKSSKSRNKRIITIYSSQNSILQPLPKGTSVPLKKANRSSVTNLGAKQKQAPKKQKQRYQTVSMKARPAQNYEKIPMYFVNSNTNSEIQFSNYGETRKDVGKSFKKPLYIDCDQEALIKQIWRQDKRKDTLQQKAAVKIQKVFRGYLTRKLLMKYVEEYESKLLRERQMLERNIRLKRHAEDSPSKLAYFSGNKASQYQWEERENPLDMESSIMAASDHHSPREQNTYDRRELEGERESFTLNESTIVRQQEISMSFGQDNQHSPHFHLPRRSRDISRSQEEAEVSRGNHHASECRHYVSEDRTGDGYSQNISSCPSQSKPCRHHERSSQSKGSSQARQESERESVHLEQLRSAEKAKWEQVIELVNGQMREGVNQERTRQLMSFILEFSLKNREELNKSPLQVTPATLTLRHEDEPRPDHLSFKKKKAEAQQQECEREEREREERVRKNENLPLSRKQREDKSLLERTSSMKEYLLKNINVQDEQIDKLMSLREAVLRKRESNSLVELNALLQNNELTQDDFLERMTALTSNFLKQKQEIEQTKDEIYQGYRAQIQLFRNTILDAKYLGYHLPFCRSMELHPTCPQWRYDELMIDELNQLARRRARPSPHPNPPELSTRKIDEMLEDSKEKEGELGREVFHESESEDEANFSYEETDIYNKCAIRDATEAAEFVLSPKNMRRINDFNRYSAVPLDAELPNAHEQKLNVSEEKPKTGQEEEEFVSLKRMPKKETFQIEYSSDEEEEVAIYQESSDRQVEDSVAHCFNTLLFDFLEDLFRTPRLADSLRPRAKKKLIEPITKQEKLAFLKATAASLPPFAEMQGRLNQKMYPNARELLVSMREELEGSECEEYYEIGHYEYILNQEICYDAIERYIDAHRQARHQPHPNTHALQEQALTAELERYASGKLKKYVQNYSLGGRIKQEETEELREEVLKIELHLVLDAWNEQLIKYRENKLGYSGIGLNEISFSLVDRLCRPLTTHHQWHAMVAATQRTIQDTINNEALHEKLIKEYEEFVSDNDSQWILYAQEGLEYGFDLTKAVEVELVFEFLEELHHINEARELQPTLSEPEEEEIEVEVEAAGADEGSESSSEHLELNEDEQLELEQKMENMNNYSDSDESFE